MTWGRYSAKVAPCTPPVPKRLPGVAGPRTCPAPTEELRSGFQCRGLWTFCADALEENDNRDGKGGRGVSRNLFSKWLCRTVARTEFRESAGTQHRAGTSAHSSWGMEMPAPGKASGVPALTSPQSKMERSPRSAPTRCRGDDGAAGHAPTGIRPRHLGMAGVTAPFDTCCSLRAVRTMRNTRDHRRS